MNTDLIFNAKVIVNFLQVSSEIIGGGGVSNEHGFCVINDLALLLKSVVRVKIVNDPSAAVGLLG